MTTNHANLTDSVRALEDELLRTVGISKHGSDRFRLVATLEIDNFLDDLIHWNDCCGVSEVFGVTEFGPA